MKGIDVSENNGTVDFQAVANEGIEFVIVRLGYGNRHLDGRFIENVKAAQDAGLKVGIYYYSYALTVESAQNEAQFVKEVLQENSIDPELGIWFDMEDADGWKERHGMPDSDMLTAMCSAFICELNDAGYEHVGIYASYSWLTDIIQTDKLADYVPYWNAQWGPRNDFPKAKMWQFTDSLNVAGQTFDGNEYFG